MLYDLNGLKFIYRLNVTHRYFDALLIDPRLAVDSDKLCVDFFDRRHDGVP
jgi:hypothetical protein